MSPPPEVSAPRGDAEPAPGVLRVRPPSPLSSGRRVALAVVAAVVVVAGVVLVAQARSADGDALPSGEWRGTPVPRAARVDGFERGGRLATAPPVDGFGTWRVTAGGPVVVDGRLRSTDIPNVVATVDAGSSDVLVLAQVVRSVAGGGMVFSATVDGVDGLWLGARSAGVWELRLRGPGAAAEVLGTFAAPTDGVAVQAVRRGDRVTVSFDGVGSDVAVPSDRALGTFVGVTSTSQGNELELFGYLPLDPG